MRSIARRRPRLLAGAAALCLTAAGCAGPDAAPAPAPASSSAAATPTASPTSPAPSGTPSSTDGSWSREKDLDRYWSEGGGAGSVSPSPAPMTSEAAAPSTGSAPADAAAASPGAASASATSVPDPTDPAAGTSTAAAADDVLPRSVPTRVRVESLGVDSPLIQLGLQEDRTVEVPSTDPGSPAGWYENSPTPGERGPAVLLGHVGDTEGGVGVFGRLHRIEPGALVEVDRADGTTAVFRVDRAVSYEKGEFPKDEVYGNTDDAQLRLITCDNYNAWTGHWDSNFVAYATLVR